MCRPTSRLLIGLERHIHGYRAQPWLRTKNGGGAFLVSPWSRAGIWGWRRELRTKAISRVLWRLHLENRLMWLGLTFSWNSLHICTIWYRNWMPSIALLVSVSISVSRFHVVILSSSRTKPIFFLALPRFIVLLGAGDEGGVDSETHSKIGQVFSDFVISSHCSILFCLFFLRR